MSCLNIVLIVVLVILVVGVSYNKMRLVEHNVSGGKRKRSKKKIGGDIDDRLESIVTKKEADEIMKEINDKFGDSKFLVDTKVDIIIDKFKGKQVKDINEILESVNIYRNKVENVYVADKGDEIYSDLHKCPRCGARKHTVREVQKRAIDEPSNVICNCLECGQKWDQD